MPFVMTHLAIAKEINDQYGFATNLPLFYLGSIAPDSVHVRSGYHSSMKKHAHFCTDPNPWGEVEDNKTWQGNVLSALKACRHRDDFDFFLGYFTHILADIHDNQTVYKIFKAQYARENLPLEKRGFAFYNDKSQNDFQLYHLFDWKTQILEMIRQADPLAVSDKITGQELDRYRKGVLEQYEIGVSPFSRPVRYFSLSDNLSFIESGIKEISKILVSVL